uniref:Uncharacterized protein n=1 Tax=Romanomermis culicivorax TaxID=13658 RepID=A0A915J5C8_ROMCU
MQSPIVADGILGIGDIQRVILEHRPKIADEFRCWSIYITKALMINEILKSSKLNNGIRLFGY